MKKIGFMYITSSGYDPERGEYIKDPYLGDVPTLGACMPNIRQRVEPGDQIALVSGSIKVAPQFVVAAFEVAEKIHHNDAHKRFPHLRLHHSKNGTLVGNVIVDRFGNQHPLDTHGSFENRIENYIVGRDLVAITEPDEIALARRQTMDFLRELFDKQGGRIPRDIIGHCSKLTEQQSEALREWLKAIKKRKSMFFVGGHAHA